MGECFFRRGYNTTRHEEPQVRGWCYTVVDGDEGCAFFAIVREFGKSKLESWPITLVDMLLCAGL